MDTSFVGRAQELRALEGLLERGERVVTLVGPPGVGKSRLARHLIESRGAAADVPARWVDLSAVDDSAGLSAALVAALGASPSGGPGGADPLVLASQALAASGPVLLVLDEFERLVRFALVTVQRWRDLAPAAQFLITSRERLRLPDELVVELGPLPVGERDGDFEADATRLLCDRVRRARGAFEPSATDVVALSRIARRLEGLPLALELAAARLDVLDPPALLERLADPFQVLREPAGLGRSLESSIACSWELLDDAGRFALSACTVFRGGFEMEAAEAVLRGPEIGDRAPLDLVQSLRDRSLLTAVDSPSGRRLGMYTAIREWAGRHLGAHETAVRERHLAHYALLARAATAVPSGRLMSEQENVLQALETGLETNAPESQDLALALDELPSLRLPLEAHFAWLDRAVRGAGPGDPRLAPLLTARSRLHRRAGRYVEARADLERALALAADPTTEGRALSMQGRVLVLEGRFEEARQSLERALVLHEKAGDAKGTIWTLTALGYVDLQGNDVARARGRLSDALERAAAGADRQGEALCHYSLGLVHHHAGALEAARSSYADALAAAQTAGDTWLAAFCQIETGLVLLEEGRPAEARRIFEAVEPWIAGIDPRGEGLLLSHEGAARALEGDLVDARRLLDAAEKLLQATDVLLLAAVVGPQRGLLDLAEAARLRSAGDDEGAAQLERRAVERLASARAAPPPDTEASRGASVVNTDLVVATRILEAALSDRGLLGGPAEGLVVGPDGEWFQAPGGARVSCARRQPLRRILVALVQARLSSPGRTLSRGEIQAAGWPGLKLRADAARNRVHVALYELRKMGLGSLLVSTDEGWRLDHRVPVRWGT